jgi:hypothetical protein
METRSEGGIPAEERMPFLGDNNETCSFASPAAGTWHVLLIGDDPYSGATLAAAGMELGHSENGGTSADQLSYANGNASAVDVYVLVWRYSSTRTTYQLKVSY